nr:hypothetical protein YJOPZNRJ_YJOPZNRJ_CDS_0006 [Microvirus sp.]
MSFFSRFKKNFSSLGGTVGFLANPIGSLTSSAGSALASNFGNGNIEDQWDLFKNGKTNQANMAMNQANIDYQNAYNDKIWNREDSSYQRTLKDMALANPIGSLTSSAGSALASNFGNGNIEDQWDLFKNGKTNQANMAMNQANIDYQNAYNDKIWNREDSSYQRTLKDMASVGMSPLAMSGLNGAGGSSDAPNYMFGWQDKGAGQAFSEVANFASQLASISNLTAQTKLVNAQADEKDLLNGLLKNKISYLNANGFVDGMSDKEKFLMLGLGALGDGNPVFTSSEDGLSFNNIANALREGIKSGSVQNSIKNLLGDVLSSQSGFSTFDIGASAVDSASGFLKGVGSNIVTKGKKQVENAKKIGTTLGNKLLDTKAGEFLKKVFSKATKKPGDKGFSKQQADARRARRGK